MVHREKNFSSAPSGLIDRKWDALKAQLLVEQHDHDVKTTCYRDTTIKALCLIYKDKCAICERKRGMELQVDHYRPKKTRATKSYTKYNQPGYYWLAYTWSNLIPLCSKCNNNKSNKFPLRGWVETNRVSSHINTSGFAPFQPYNLLWLNNQEQPLIINPEVETRPERHFIFLKNGSIRGRTQEGNATIEICKLNRKDLRRERVEIRQGYVQDIKEALAYYDEYRNVEILRGELLSVFRRIKRNVHRDQGHSLFHVFIYKYFDYNIGSFFSDLEVKDYIVDCFNSFKK